MTDSADDTPRYKVGKVIERRALDGMGRSLESYWLGDQAESYSLRELADYFNREVLRNAITQSERQPLQRDIESIYETLTGDDVSRGERIRVRKALERDGVDVDQLRRDFVTHQAVHTYLTKEREVSKDSDTGDRVERTRETIDRLRSRLVAVTETSLGSLRDAGLLSVGSFDVFVEVNVHCTDCGTHRSISELLTAGGCDCDDI